MCESAAGFVVFLAKTGFHKEGGSGSTPTFGDQPDLFNGSAGGLLETQMKL